MLRVVQGLMDSASLDGGGGLGGEDRVKVGLCGGELFAPQYWVAPYRHNVRFIWQPILSTLPIPDFPPNSFAEIFKAELRQH